MFRSCCLLPGLFFLSCTLTAWAVCTDCAEDLQLDRGELECTKLKIDDWIDSSRNHGVVEVILDKCATSEPGVQVALSSVPTRGDQTESKSDQVWILSTAQLLCLKDYLPDLRINQQNYAYFHFSACPV